MNPRRTLHIVAFALFFLTATHGRANAGFYFNPMGGAYIPANGGDTSYNLGVAAGYAWTEHWATELIYQRLFGTGSTPDGNLFQGRALYGTKFGIISPYLSAGGGVLQTSLPGDDEVDPLLTVGGGIGLNLGIISVTGSVDYVATLDGPDYIAPGIGLGVTF